MPVRECKTAGNGPSLQLSTLRIEVKPPHHAISLSIPLAAQITAALLHEQLIAPTQQPSPAYTQALAPLIRFHRNLPAVQYVHTMRVTPTDKLFFVLDTAADADIRTSQEALGRSILPSPLMELYQLPYTAAENAALLALLRSGTTFVDKSPFTDEYGRFVTAHTPLFDTAGTFTGFVGLDYNIDQYEYELAVMRNYGLFSLLLALLVSAGLARLMLQLRQQALDNLREAALARQRAEKANQAKSELLAIATHDLKNPLSAISSMAELLINLKTTNQVLPTQEIACLQNIRESSRHMFALVRRILDNEKLESGMLALEKTTVDLTALCRSVIAANIRAAEGKQLHIVANLHESLVVEADPDHLLEAFDNYLNNAWRFGGLRQPPRQGGPLLGTAAASIGDVTIAAVTLRRQQIVHRCQQYFLFRLLTHHGNADAGSGRQREAGRLRYPVLCSHLCQQTCSQCPGSLERDLRQHQQQAVP